MASYQTALPEDLKALLEDYLIDENRMEQGDFLGEGNFGEVYEGTLADLHDPSKRDKVAIKTLKVGRTEGLTKFLQEAAIMKGFDHDNVLSLIGVVIKDSYTYILLPYMAEGNLQTYVSKARNRITPKQLMELTHQVAKGMDYLAKRKVVHRDLAARNCLVNSAGLVKVADFGLTRDIAVKDYYRTTNRELPYKWMALESIETLRFDTKSDVWSFGVLMWETMSYGAKPYSRIQNRRMFEYLKSGNRLEKPNTCPDAFYAIMQKCWMEAPAQRPTFSQLKKEIEDFLKQTESSSGDIPTSLTPFPQHKLKYKASYYVGFSYKNDILLADKKKTNLFRLFHFDGNKYSQTWVKKTPAGMDSGCKKAISTDGDILLQGSHVDGTVRHNRNLQKQQEHQFQGILIDCREDGDVMLRMAIENTDYYKIEVRNPSGNFVMKLQRPAGEWGWAISVCTTRSRMVVTETSSLNIFSLKGDYVRHLDIPYEPAFSKAVTQCGSGDYFIIAERKPPCLHVYNVLTAEEAEAATFSHQQLGLSKDEYVHGVRCCDGVLHIATGDIIATTHLHAYKVNFTTSDQEESAPGASYQSTTSDSTSNPTGRTASMRSALTSPPRQPQAPQCSQTPRRTSRRLASPSPRRQLQTPQCSQTPRRTSRRLASHSPPLQGQATQCSQTPSDTSSKKRRERESESQLQKKKSKVIRPHP